MSTPVKIPYNNPSLALDIIPSNNPPLKVRGGWRGYAVRLAGIFLLSILIFTLSTTLAHAQLVEDPCAETGEIRLQVPIPGLDRIGAGTQAGCVKDLPNYINGVYNFFSVSVGILAVTMMMIGSFRWILAAGNQTRITSAHQTIWGGVMGLILVLGSFYILNTLNPRLVHLELPSIPKPDTIEIGSLFCDGLDKNANVISVTDIDSFLKKSTGPRNIRKADIATCGVQFAALDSSGKQVTKQRCLGHYCSAKGQACFEVDDNQWGCENFILGGGIKSAGKRYVDHIDLRGVCVGEKSSLQFTASGSLYAFAGIDTNERSKDYNFQTFKGSGDSDNPDKIYCDRYGVREMLGFYLSVEVNEENAFDDDFFIGPQGCSKKKGEQSEPMTQKNKNGEVTYNNFDWREFKEKEGMFWTKQQLEDGGVECNIEIGCSNKDDSSCKFPTLDDDVAG